MQCPVDGETLVMTDRNGVEIDYCPKCRGVWLDRGELDKIIDRTGGGVSAVSRSAVSPAAVHPAQAAPQPVYQPEPSRARRDDEDDDDRRPRRKRRDSFLSDIFDF
jgi:hypothetical protein